MNKNEVNHDIDVVEICLILWKKKLIIISTVFFALIIMLISDLNKKPSKILIKSSINPINSYDEAEYKILNSVLGSLEPYLFKFNIIEEQFQDLTTSEYVRNGFIFNNIDRKFFYNLFIDTVTKKGFIVRVIKNSDFIDKDNYSSQIEYDTAVLNIASSIKIINDLSNNRNSDDEFDYKSIQYSLNENDIEKWNNFLIFLEKNVNNQLRNDFHEIINIYLDYADKLKKYRLEDINNQISFATSESEKSILQRKKESFLADKYNDRLKNLFDNSPIAKSNNDFYAAKIVSNLGNYKIKSNGFTKNIFITVVLGLIFGILFALLTNAIQNRK